MRKTITTILILLGLTLIIVAFSVKAFPQWVSLPGGIFLLLVAAFTGIAELGGKLKDWREFLFDNEKPSPEPNNTITPQEKYSVDISGNIMEDETKIGIYRDDVRIANNPMRGKTEIEVGQKAQHKKRKSKKG